ncbi:hypothetical protein PLESTB_000988400 [Pleodorina starrii]|uniref:Nephrocystin 3-like N-terminal domain-containing protein n=1 Tax=Pleodorina starrii TaxID=330485 RepID=A0A9W6BNQ9_9CHLO|nr:hypothetical protein PLESTM_000551000 [Pleodorina starrii]GLC55449.1 hypothetical protein PLESTB_000988400 [Pleodorina starrii]GLC73842.1 hypothetical protein PLESTF_001426800 [Pleodorina starrii]
MGKGGGCGASKAVRVPSVTSQPVVQDEDDEAFWHLYVSWTGEDEQGIDRPATAPAAGGTNTGAVRLSFLLEFLATRLPLGDPNMPTWSIALNVVQPATIDAGLPYIALPEVAPHVLPYGTTTPYYFVSHAWSRPLREAADMLCHHFRGRDPREVFVWLDVFAVPQQSFTAAPRGPDVAMLDAAIRNSGGVLLCLDEAGLALRRTWCLYEAWLGATASSLAEAAAAGAAGAAAAGAGRGSGEGSASRPGSAGPGPGGGGAAAEPPPLGVTALTPRAMLPEERARLFSKIDVRQSRCKYKVDRDALLAAARAVTGPGGLDAVNHTLRLALMLRPLVPDVYHNLHPGRMIRVPELWDMGRVDGWLALPESNRNFSALALYGPACSGKSVAAAAVAAHLRSLGIPTAAHFCNVSDVRTLDPVAVVVSLALQLAQAPGIGPRLLRQYGELPAGLMADLVSYNNTATALEAAVEALLVQPLQRLLQPPGSSDGAAAADAGAANGGGRQWQDNGDVGALGGGCDEDLEAELAGGEGGAGGRGLTAAGARSIRPRAGAWSGPPKVVVLILDGVDQADGAIMGGSAPFDNQVLQLIEEHLPKLPSFVRLVLTSRSLSYIVPRLADRISPLELAPEALRPPGPLLRNVRLALANIDPSLARRHRAAAAANLVSQSRGSLLYIKLALCCLELERDVALAEAEAGLPQLTKALSSKRSSGGSGGGGEPQEGVRRTLSRLASTKKQSSSQPFPSSLGGLLERYLNIRLRLLNSIELRNKAATVLAVLAAARESLTAMQIAAAVGVRQSAASPPSTSQVSAAAAPSPLLALPPVAAARLLQGFVAAGLGALVQLRGRPGHLYQEVMLVHSAVSEWLQPKPRVLLGGSVIVDLAAGHRALASHCRDDALGCIHRGRLTPYGYSVRHIFLHVGLAAMAASAEEAAAAAAAGGVAAGALSPSSAATPGRLSAAQLHSRSGTTSSNSSAAAALAAALAAASAAADWISTLELLLQRLDLWTSIYSAGAGGAARWVVLALASLPSCAIPSADPGSSDSTLPLLLAEARRWLLMYHSQLCWFPLAVVSSAATLPEDSTLRSRALEFSAGPDPYEYQPTVTTITVAPAHSRGGAPAATTTTTTATTTATAAGSTAPPPPSTPPTATTADGDTAAPSLEPPLEEGHLLLLSTGDMWSACMQTLRTGVAGRVLQVAMQPAGRLLAMVLDGSRGVILWDIWAARPLLTMARSTELGPNPTTAFFTPDGRKLICAARSVFIWEVSTGRLLHELWKAPPRKGGPGALGSIRVGSTAATPTTTAAAAAAADTADPDGPVMALALSPGGSRVAAGHANGVTRVWEVATGKLLASMVVPHRRPVTALGFSLPVGATLIAAHGEGGDAAPKALAPVQPEELGDVPTAYIKADELPIHVWRIQGNTPKELEILKGHTGRVNSLVFSTLNRNMVTGSADETIRTWWDDPKTPQSDYRQTFILGGAGQGAVHTILFSPVPPPPPPPPKASWPPPPVPPPNARNSSGGSAAAADGDVETPVVDFTAPSVACLTNAAFGKNNAPSYDAGGAATPDVPGSAIASARGSAAGTGPDAGAAAAVGDGAAEAGGRGDLPVMSYSCGNGIIRLWSPVQQRQVGLLRGLDGAVNSLSFSGDGRLLASADQSDPGVVRVWDVGGASVSSPLDCSPSSGAGGLPLRHPVEIMSLSPDGSRLAVVCADLTRENIRVIDVFTGRRLAVMGPGGAGGHDRKINCVGWSWDSSRLATGSDDLSVRVWYVGKPTAPPGNALAAAAAIVAAELEARERAAPPPPPSPPPPPPAPPPGRSIEPDLSASRHLMRVRSESGGGASGGGAATAAAAAATAAAAAAADGAVSIRPGQCQLILTGHHRKVQCVAWAHSGKKLASGGYDQMIRIWDSSTGEQLTLIYQVSWVSALAFSPDDARLASGAGGRAVYMFNSTTGKNLAGHSGVLPGEGGTAPAVAMSSGGGAEGLQQPAEAGGAKGAKGAKAGEVEAAAASASDTDSWMAALRFNPDGTLLACRDMHSVVTLWDVSGMRLRPLRALDGTFREALFCPTSGDLQLYDLTAAGALVVSAIPARSLPLGRAVQRAVTLSHPLLEFRGVAVDTAVNHNGVVLLTADNRAFFFVNGAHLAAVRQEASRAQRAGGAAGNTGGGWSVTTFGGGGGGGGGSR